MIRISFFSAAVAILLSFSQGSSAHAAAPEEQLIEAVKVARGAKDAPYLNDMSTKLFQDWSF